GREIRRLVQLWRRTDRAGQGKRAPVVQGQPRCRQGTRYRVARQAAGRRAHGQRRRGDRRCRGSRSLKKRGGHWGAAIPVIAALTIARWACSRAANTRSASCVRGWNTRGATKKSLSQRFEPCKSSTTRTIPASVK